MRVQTRKPPRGGFVWSLRYSSPRSACSTPNTTQAQLGAAVAGLGIALLPTLMTALYIQQGELQEVLPGHGLEDVGVYFVYLSRKQIPRAVSAFTEFAMATTHRSTHSTSHPLRPSNPGIDITPVACDVIGYC